jgi:Zn-finger protein
MQGQTKKYSFCFAPFWFLAKEKGRFFEAGEANP